MTRDVTVTERQGDLTRATPWKCAARPRGKELAYGARMFQSGSSIGFRLAAAFGALLALFGAAMIVVMSSLAEIGEAEREMVIVDHAKHAGHMVAFQVREQHLRQAHAIIARLPAPGDYEPAVHDARMAVGELASYARSAGERATVERIAALAALVETQFSRDVVPLIATAEPKELAAAHRALLDTVEEVIALNDELGAIFEQRSSAAQARAEELRGTVRLVAIGCFAVALLAAAILGFLMTRSIGRPLAALEAAARRVAAGDLSTRLAVAGGGELTALAGSFNTMAAELRRHQEGLLRTGRLASIGQVAAGVAHEINNPLGVILGYATMLGRSAESADLQKDLGIIEAEARQCQRIVQDLLDLARPQNYLRADVDVGEIAEEARARLAETRTLGDRTVAVDIATRLVASGDESKLRQVVDNLLANAVDATPPHGRIEIAGRRDNGTVVVTVRDSGAGIAADVMPRLFEPFFTTKAKGTGLGLAICQAIIDAHQGTIEAASPPGGGAVFTVRLPAPPSPGGVS